MVIRMENNNLSEFMKIAYKNGRVKDLAEAFKEFPVEEYKRSFYDSINNNL